jgi:predicted ATPase
LGGVGKTRLAVQAAREVAGDFPDGVWFVDLAAVAEPAGVLPQIARTLGVAYSKRCPALRQVTGHLRAQQALLVLDGADHLISAAAQIAALLTAAPQITILVTSRRPLHIYSEQVIAAGPLALPAGSLTAEQVGAAPAGQLFVARARAVCPGFTLDDTTAPRVATICTRLAGLPLAIELAADRLRGLPLAAILARIDKPYTLLTDGALGLPVRQQSLRANMDWSYNLLAPEEQTLLRRLSVFPAGGTLEEIAAVCTPGAAVAADLLDRLATLVTHNLLQIETCAGGDPRYQMPALVQCYAADLLVADPAAATIRQRYRQFSEQRLPQRARRTPIPRVVPAALQPPAVRSRTGISYESFCLTTRFSPPIVEAPDPATHIARLQAPAPISALLPDDDRGALPPLRAAPLYTILHNQRSPRKAPLPRPAARAPDRRTPRRRTC